ncbi:MAG TPA: hypothetical protein DIS90_10085 [Cytophagales bacterium]|nr:hypothetical protein [Cytophagales bacterium]HCR55059.1 hypothetical protein [Cytophagales bacterium]
MKTYLILLYSLMAIGAYSQDTLPYFKIPDYPKAYTAGTVAARVVDGLGFRYYWATEGLRTEDLQYKPNEDARTCEETLQHIHAMSFNLVNATKRIPSEPSKINSQLPFEILRSETLHNLKTASDILKKSTDKDLNGFDLLFKGDNYEVKYPFWNLLNGPIADAIWHVGQVVTFRRSSGNPFNSNVSVLNGELKND